MRCSFSPAIRSRVYAETYTCAPTGILEIEVPINCSCRGYINFHRRQTANRFAKVIDIDPDFERVPAHAVRFGGFLLTPGELSVHSGQVLGGSKYRRIANVISFSEERACASRSGCCRSQSCR